MFYYLTCNRYRRSPSLACACAGCERDEGRCRADSSSTGALCGELSQSVQDSSSLSCLEDPLRSKHDDTLQPLRNNSMIRSKYQKLHINRLLCALSLGRLLSPEFMSTVSPGVCPSISDKPFFQQPANVGYMTCKLASVLALTGRDIRVYTSAYFPVSCKNSGCESRKNI